MKHLAKNETDSALTDGFLLSIAVNIWSAIDSSVVYKYY